MTIRETADAVRCIPLEEVVHRYGYERTKKDGRGEKYVLPDGRLIRIEGERFWDFSEDCGGGGAIDLAMHLMGLDFLCALTWLSDMSLDRETAISCTRAERSETDRTDSFLLPPYDPDKVRQMFGYLIRRRHIAPETVRNMLQSKRIYPTTYGSIVFVHRDVAGCVTGASIRGNGSTFKQTIGRKFRGAFWIGDGTVVVLVESPIDALSYVALFPQVAERVRVVSMAGLGFSEQLLKSFGCTVWINGFDNPQQERNEHAAQANRRTSDRLASLAQSLDIACIRHTPANKDWNEDLCQSCSSPLPAELSEFLVNVDAL